MAEKKPKSIECGRVCHRVAMHRWRIPISVNEV